MRAEEGTGETAAAGNPVTRREPISEFIPENGMAVSRQRLAERRPDARPRRRLQEMDMEMVEQILKIPPERLHQMRRTIEDIERMTPREKEKLQHHLRRFRNMPKDQRSQLLQRWNGVPDNHRMRLRQHWSSLSGEERERERSKIQGMNPEERHAYFRSLFTTPGSSGATRETLEESTGDPDSGGSGPSSSTESPASPSR